MCLLLYAHVRACVGVTVFVLFVVFVCLWGTGWSLSLLYGVCLCGTLCPCVPLHSIVVLILFVSTLVSVLVSPSLYLSVCLNGSLCVCLCVCLFSLSVCVCVSLSLTVCVCLCPFCLFLYLCCAWFGSSLCTLNSALYYTRLINNRKDSSCSY